MQTGFWWGKVLQNWNVEDQERDARLAIWWMFGSTLWGWITDATSSGSRPAAATGTGGVELTDYTVSGLVSASGSISIRLYLACLPVCLVTCNCFLVVKVKLLSLCFTKNNAMKTYWGSGCIAPRILWPRH